MEPIDPLCENERVVIFHNTKYFDGIVHSSNPGNFSIILGMIPNSSIPNMISITGICNIFKVEIPPVPTGNKNIREMLFSLYTKIYSRLNPMKSIQTSPPKIVKFDADKIKIIRSFGQKYKYRFFYAKKKYFIKVYEKTYDPSDPDTLMNLREQI